MFSNDTNDHDQSLKNVSRFLFHEADLLDRREYNMWLDLFDNDGIYWLPSSIDQTDMKRQVSIILEDKPILKIRIDRLNNPQAQAVVPQRGMVHFISNIWVEETMEDDNIISVHSSIMLSEGTENGERLMTGRMTHHLRCSGDEFYIKLKRVDLVRMGGVYDPINILI